MQAGTLWISNPQHNVGYPEIKGGEDCRFFWNAPDCDYFPAIELGYETQDITSCTHVKGDRGMIWLHILMSAGKPNYSSPEWFLA